MHNAVVNTTLNTSQLLQGEVVAKFRMVRGVPPWMGGRRLSQFHWEHAARLPDNVDCEYLDF